MSSIYRHAYLLYMLLYVACSREQWICTSEAMHHISYYHLFIEFDIAYYGIKALHNQNVD